MSLACLGAALDSPVRGKAISVILQSWAEQLLHASSVVGRDGPARDGHGGRVSRRCSDKGGSSSFGAVRPLRADISEAAAASAIARLSECDDIHLASCVTPGSVVIPVALAFAGKSGGEDFNRAVAAGYAAGIDLGMGIGGARALASGVWPTLVAAPLMAAVTASCAQDHDAGQLAHAMALALGGASGRLGRPAGTPSGRWFALAEAVAKGIRASEAAGRGFQGDLALISEQWLNAQAGHDAVDIGAFESRPRLRRYAMSATSPFRLRVRLSTQ